ADLVLETVELNGNGIVFNGHNTGALRNSTGNNTFTGTLVLKTNSTIGVDSNQQLTIGSKPGLPGTGTITDGPSSFSLPKELQGRLILNSANTYDGLTDVIQGALQVANAGALGGTANGTSVRNGAALEINTDTAGNGITVVGEALALSGTGIFGTGAIRNIAGNNTWQADVTLTSIPGIPAPPPTTPPNKVAMGVDAGVLSIDRHIGEAGRSFGIDKVAPRPLGLQQ